MSGKQSVMGRTMVKVENLDHLMEEGVEVVNTTPDSGGNIERAGVHKNLNKQTRTYSCSAKKETNVKIDKEKLAGATSSNSTMCNETSENEQTEINENFDILEEYKNCYLSKFGDLFEYSRKIKLLEDELAVYKDNGSDGTLNDDIRVFKKLASKYLSDKELIDFYVKQMENPPSDKNTLRCLYEHINNK